MDYGGNSIGVGLVTWGFFSPARHQPPTMRQQTGRQHPVLRNILKLLQHPVLRNILKLLKHPVLRNILKLLQHRVLINILELLQPQSSAQKYSQTIATTIECSKIFTNY